MTFENSFTLKEYMTQAQQHYQATVSRLDALDDILAKQMGGNTQSGLIAGLVGSAVWVAVYIVAFTILTDMNHTPFLTIALITSLVLMAVMILGRFLRTKYYSSIQRTRDQVAQMKSRVQLAESSLSANLHTYQSCRSAQWNCALEPGESIPDEAEIIERSVGSLESFRSGILGKLQNVLYYVVCAAWTVGGIQGLKPIFTSFFSDYVSYDTAGTILIIGTVIVLVLDLIFARFLWGQGDCNVDNITLFASIAGPVAFAILTVVITLALGLLYLVFQLIVGLIVLVIGGSIVMGALSGG